MSLQLLEICGVVAALVALTALFHRALHPLLLRLSEGRLEPAGAPDVEGAALASLERNPLQPRRATRSRLGSPA